MNAMKCPWSCKCFQTVLLGLKFEQIFLEWSDIFAATPFNYNCLTWESLGSESIESLVNAEYLDSAAASLSAMSLRETCQKDSRRLIQKPDNFFIGSKRENSKYFGFFFEVLCSLSPSLTVGSKQQCTPTLSVWRWKVCQHVTMCHFVSLCLVNNNNTLKENTY